MFRMCTSGYYTANRTNACVCLMNSWRPALCPSVTVPLKERRTSPSDAKLWPTACIVTVWRHCMGEDVCILCSTSWCSGCKGTARDIPQDLVTFSQQRSAFPLPSSLSSWKKQGTSSDVSFTSAHFVVQPTLLRRFAGGLCWTQTLGNDSSARSGGRTDLRLIRQYHHQDGLLLVHAVGWLRNVPFDDLWHCPSDTHFA